MELQPSTSPRRLGAIVLAAGMSSRMGSHKALLDLDGRPLISRLIDCIEQLSQVERTIVVTGHQAAGIRDAVTQLNSMRVNFIHNAAHEAGEMISSVKAGASAVWDAWDGFFLLLLDQPILQSDTLHAMAEAFKANNPSMVVPTYREKRGHPLLIASRCVTSIVTLPPDATLREFVSQVRDATVMVEVDDPGIVTDVDTPEDYQRIVQLWRTHPCPAAPTARNAP